MWAGQRILAIRKLIQALAALDRQTTTGLLEAFIGCGVLTVIGFIVPQHWGMQDIQPNPLWIVVIAIAIRYGAVPGYAAGAMAALSYTLFLSLQPGPHLHIPSAHELLQPFLLLVGGVVIGELGRSQQAHLAAMRQRYETAGERLRSLAEREQDLVNKNAELQDRLLKQKLSPLTLYNVAKKLNVLRVDAIYPAILDVVAYVLGAEASALYLWHEERLQLCAGSPAYWPDRQETWDSPTGVVALALSEGRVVTIQDRLVDEGPDAVTDEPIMMAGPLLDCDGQPLGIVVVERLPFMKLNATNVRLFQAILEWSSIALANALEHEALQRKALTAQSSLLSSY